MDPHVSVLKQTSCHKTTATRGGHVCGDVLFWSSNIIFDLLKITKLYKCIYMYVCVTHTHLYTHTDRHTNKDKYI